MEKADEETIRLELSDPDLREQGLTKLVKNYRNRVFIFIRKRFPGLPLQCTEELVNDAFTAIWQKSVKGVIDLEKPIHNLLFQIAFYKATDRLRKLKRKQDIDDDLIIERHLSIKGTDINFDWEMVLIGDQKVIKEKLTNFINSLPEKEGVVGLAILQSYPLTPDIEYIRDFAADFGTHLPLSSTYKIKEKVLQKFINLVKEMTK